MDFTLFLGTHADCSSYRSLGEFDYSHQCQVKVEAHKPEIHAATDGSVKVTYSNLPAKGLQFNTLHCHLRQLAQDPDRKVVRIQHNHEPSCIREAQT